MKLLIFYVLVLKVLVVTVSNVSICNNNAFVDPNFSPWNDANQMIYEENVQRATKPHLARISPLDSSQRPCNSDLHLRNS